jgi:hypothetical protein
VFKQKLSQILDQFRRELQRFDERSPVSESLDALQEALEIIPELAKWRNDRVHARVDLTEQGYALRNWQTGLPLEITPEQIPVNINLAIKAMVLLEGHVPHLVGQLIWDEENRKLFSTIPELSEAPDRI